MKELLTISAAVLITILVIKLLPTILGLAFFAAAIYFGWKTIKPLL